MPVLLILGIVFVVVPILELAVIITVGQAIGVWPTIGLLVADSLLGAVLLRTQGRAAWRRLNAALSEGRVPTTEVLDGVLVTFGGALLLTPGFASDALGALLILPPTRAVIRRVAMRRVAARALAGMSGGFRGPFGGGASFGANPFARGRATDPRADDRAHSFDVESTAHDVHDDPRLRP